MSLAATSRRPPRRSRRIRPAVLDLLVAPAPGKVLEDRVVVKHLAEIFGVIGSVALDEARRLDDAQQLDVNLAGLEAIPGDVVQRPMAHLAACLALDRRQI